MSVFHTKVKRSVQKTRVITESLPNGMSLIIFDITNKYKELSHQQTHKTDRNPEKN